MPKPTIDYRAALLEDLKDPTEAAEYLNAALEEDTPEVFLTALRDVAEARQMASVAEQAGVAREALYRMLALSGNPTYKNLISIIQALGLEFGGVKVPGGSVAPVPTGTAVVSAIAAIPRHKRGVGDLPTSTIPQRRGLFLVSNNSAAAPARVSGLDEDQTAYKKPVEGESLGSAEGLDTYIWQNISQDHQTASR